MDSHDTVIYQQQFETIDNPQRIHSLLSQCAKQRVQLHFSLNRRGEFFSAELEKLDETHACLYFSELRPRLGQRLLRGTRRLQIFTQLNGSEINFEADVIRVKSALFRTRNCLAMPKKIKYFQRRQDHRVHISMAMDVHASINSSDGDALRGQIRDLSSSGMRVQFYQSTPGRFDQLPIVQDCVIALPEDEPIRCRFTVHHMQHNQRNRGFAVGGSFDALHPEQKKMLQRFLARVEREALRAYR